MTLWVSCSPTCDIYLWTKCAEQFAWHWVTCSCSRRTDIPNGLYSLEFRATQGQDPPRHQRPVVLINLGKEGRNHLPSCVPISFASCSASLFPHIRRMFQDPRQTNGGSLFHTALDYSFFLLQADAQFSPSVCCLLPGSALSQLVQKVSLLPLWLSTQQTGASLTLCLDTD